MAGLNRKAAIIGVGETAVGILPESTALGLYVEAAELALADAGMKWSDIDGLYTAVSRVDPHPTGSAALAEHLGLRPKFALSMPVGGMQVTACIYQAAAMVLAGIADNIMVICADNLLSGMSRAGAVDHYADTGHPDFENPMGAMIPSLYALAAQRHMHEYGTTPEQLAAVAVQFRQNAGRHPKAHKRTPITIEDVLDSKMIATPFHMLDCSLISDGGCAFIITSAERARDARQTPVFLLGAGEGRAHQHMSQSPSLTSFAAREASQRAYAMAGLGPKDIDVAMLYDPFTISPIISLESLGFCPVGEGGRFVEDGHIAPTGSIPVNTHGGLLSYAHPGRPGGVLLVVEAMRQLRREAAERQIPDAEIALVQANAGITSGEVTLILGR
jgi:acetyl-CoA acetyltransferase